MLWTERQMMARCRPTPNASADLSGFAAELTPFAPRIPVRR